MARQAEHSQIVGEGRDPSADPLPLISITTTSHMLLLLGHTGPLLQRQCLVMKHFFSCEKQNPLPLASRNSCSISLCACFSSVYITITIFSLARTFHCYLCLFSKTLTCSSILIPIILCCFCSLFPSFLAPPLQ